MADHGRNKIQAGIQPTGHAPRRNDPQPTQPQARPPRIALPPLDALLPSIAALPRNALPPPIRPLGQNKRILLLILAQLETGVINHIILLHHIRLLQLAPPRRILADNLHLGVVIRVRGGRQTLQHAGSAQDQTPRADGHERALFGGVGGLEFAEGFEEGNWLGGLGAVVDDAVDAFGGAAGDDEHVVFLEVVVRVRVVDVGFDG